MGVVGGDKYREMAERNTFLRALVGSTIHGLALEGTDDRDEMGICIEDFDVAVGFSPFEQYIYRSAAEREGKHNARSQPGDLDLTIYSMRKYLKLAMQGNPNMLTLLFVPGDKCEVFDARAGQMRELIPSIISQQVGWRYLGYLRAQKERLLGERGGKDVNRPELVEKYGFDTKYAMHALRLGFQGIEILSTGKLSLPMHESTRHFLMQVRVGLISLKEVTQIIKDLENTVSISIELSDLPEEPDSKKVEAWMLEMYWNSWNAQRNGGLGRKPCIG